MASASIAGNTMTEITKTKLSDSVNSYLGMTIALASMLMLFGSLFVCYLIVRFRQSQWPPMGTPELPVFLPMINTIVLLLSSILLHRSIQKLEASNNHAFKFWLLSSVIMGFAFLACQWLLMQKLADIGIYVHSGALGSVFYGITLFHGIHVIAGLIGLLSLLPGAFSGHYIQKGSLSVRIVALFWHFIDVVWIFLYVSLFLV